MLLSETGVVRVNDISNVGDVVDGIVLVWILEENETEFIVIEFVVVKTLSMIFYILYM